MKMLTQEKINKKLLKEAEQLKYTGKELGIFLNGAYTLQSIIQKELSKKTKQNNPQPIHL